MGKTQVWAVVGKIYGGIRVSEPKLEEPHTIKLGQGLNDREADANDLQIGSIVPPLELLTLTGESASWNPVSTTDRLLVLCPLWHPASRTFIPKAQQWSIEYKAAIELISLDWNLEQAQREAHRLNATVPTFFAGPGTLRLDTSWRLRSAMAALLVSPDGKIAKILHE